MRCVDEQQQARFEDNPEFESKHPITIDLESEVQPVNFK
ncbi:Uncharacterized protein AC511_2488 [Pseudomonas coronafaciens pv. oryzae]|nr:Uncharacterized protein AC511_2488 [Pseudomonas coronafaciens pv. oryzae]